MNTELFGVISIFIVSIVLAIPLGRYIAKIYSGDTTFLDPIFNPIEKFIFKISGINSTEQMNWKQHLKALLSVNMVWFFLCFFVLLFQGSMPLNPDNNPNMTPDLAFNTAISFVVNCNLQHYSGEAGVSYLSQMVLMFLQFVSAGVGMAAAAMVFTAMKERTTDKLGNFYNYFIKSCTRILLPLSGIVAIALLFSGTPMTFEGKDSITTLQGDSVAVSRGPAAAFIGIKHIGTNGGGFFGANSTHPLENPTYFTNAVELWAQLIIPFAMIFVLGFYLKKRKLSYVVFGVMTIGFLLLVVPTLISELNGNLAIEKMGISQVTGAMEGKEVRFGPAISGFWSIATTVISTGSVNSMHDSSMPVSGSMQLLAMMVNAFYGGCGVGFLNFYIFIILAVFISGLMVGWTC